MWGKIPYTCNVVFFSLILLVVGVFGEMVQVYLKKEAKKLKSSHFPWQKWLQKKPDFVHDFLGLRSTASA